jgi:hypothetical protein
LFQEWFLRNVSSSSREGASVRDDPLEIGRFREWNLGYDVNGLLWLLDAARVAIMSVSRPRFPASQNRNLGPKVRLTQVSGRLTHLSRQAASIKPIS